MTAQAIYYSSIDDLKKLSSSKLLAVHLAIDFENMFKAHVKIFRRMLLTVFAASNFHIVNISYVYDEKFWAIKKNFPHLNDLWLMMLIIKTANSFHFIHKKMNWKLYFETFIAFRTFPRLNRILS